jgi:uncharacterized protein
LSKDALAGNVPLRTFGQLKQLWEARVEDAPDSVGEQAGPSGQPSADSVKPPVNPPMDQAETGSAATQVPEDSSQRESNAP